MNPELAKRTLDLLRGIEWTSDDLHTRCPQCEQREPGTGSNYSNPDSFGHDPDCELAVLIRELEAVIL